MHACLQKNETGESTEEEEDIEPEMYIQYDKKAFNKVFFSHPSLFPFAAAARLIKLILQAILVFGVIVLALIVIAFAKVKETHSYFFLRDQIRRTGTIQSLISSFGPPKSTPDTILQLNTPTSSCSSLISLQTLVEDTAPLLGSVPMYDWDWIGNVFLAKEEPGKVNNST
ncbi:uncharacterized protein CDAR_265791 [Caerostris darwini]|uniref:Uncharacterized protein n=1 Tax=Caerostris darwini TaxID=1538125 RepID=A0AAV4V9F7_9ARAC|nr:uncharacterized protein CDAR_265791 [Caerostris darwini]